MFHEGSRLNANVRRSVAAITFVKCKALLGFLVCVVIHARFSSRQNLAPTKYPNLSYHNTFLHSHLNKRARAFYFRWAITSFTAVRISWIVCLGSLAPKMAVPATRTLEPAHKDQSCAPNLIKPAILPLPIYPFSGVRVFLAIYKKKKNTTYRPGRIDKHCQIQHHHRPGCSSQGISPSIP